MDTLRADHWLWICTILWRGPGRIIWMSEEVHSQISLKSRLWHPRALYPSYPKCVWCFGSTWRQRWVRLDLTGLLLWFTSPSCSRHYPVFFFFLRTKKFGPWPWQREAVDEGPRILRLMLAICEGIWNDSIARWLVRFKLRPYFVSPQILAGKYTEVGGAFVWKIELKQEESVWIGTGEVRWMWQFNSFRRPASMSQLERGLQSLKAVVTHATWTA